uniref:Uncharacterized protein n=1 Tax=Zooxanthella nutricula TaxID=1333877 RepID=A0A6U6USX7_9DINO
METAAALMATGSVVYWVARQAEKASHRIVMGSATLPSTLSDGIVGDESMLVVTAVHIRRAHLTPQAAGKRLRPCVKYGLPGYSVKCELDEVTTVAPNAPDAVSRAFVGRTPCVADAVHADISQTCLFLAHRNAPVVRLRFLEAGVGRRVFAKAEVDIPPLGEGQKSVDLVGVSANRAKKVGSIDVSVEVLTIRAGGLQRCLSAFGAKRRESAIVIDFSTLSCGAITESGTDERHGFQDDVDVLQGQAVPPVDILAGDRTWN